MSEIKFRIWDKHYNRFIDKCFIDSSCGLAGYIDDDGFNTCEEYELNRYTGLKDKKGVEIYEGDIVADMLDGEILMVGDIQFDFGIFGVEWVDCKKNKSMVGSWGQKHNLRRLDDDIVDRIEIIGNIYDNPELIREGENE